MSEAFACPSVDLTGSEQCLRLARSGSQLVRNRLKRYIGTSKYRYSLTTLRMSRISLFPNFSTLLIVEASLPDDPWSAQPIEVCGYFQEQVWHETVYLPKPFWYREEVLFRLSGWPGSCYSIWVSLNSQFGCRSFQFLRISSVWFQARRNGGWIVMCSRLW